MSSPSSRVSAVRLGVGQGRITVGVAAVSWLVCWLAGNVLGSLVIGATGHEGGTSETPVWVTLLGALALWLPIVAGLREVSHRFGLGSMVDDYGLSFKPVDAVGIPIGILTQLVLVRLVYWPLETWFPDTFTVSDREENARTLYDSANGLWVVGLVLVVVVGAPLVEEMLYRGLLQGAFTRRVNEILAVVLVAGWFAVIHFRPIEYPGLFVVGLVLGTCALVTRRLGLGIVAHAAFNATGLAWVATR
jgi:membrane protease YdiL (CAAX protease family)